MPMSFELVIVNVEKLGKNTYDLSRYSYIVEKYYLSLYSLRKKKLLETLTLKLLSIIQTPKTELIGSPLSYVGLNFNWGQ